ncbi:MAG: thiolase domain-containing protein [Deltaproteobacteria bacterium]|nr:thiolase domain-containing protein [Deltaproteobacteria bacterium]
MTRVGVVGVGQTHFGKRTDANVMEIACEALREALGDAGLTPDALDASVIGSVPEYHKQRSLAGVVQEYLGLTPRPTWLCEAACASGSAAIRSAWLAIRAGVHEVVAVIGCQKMSELTTPEILALMGRVGDVHWESAFGTTFPGYYAMFAQRHMYAHGTTREQLAAVAVKNHHYGAQNPKAMFQKAISLEKVLSSRYVASPLTMLDCCGNADGAVCIILAAEKRARAISDRVVWLDGLGCASAAMSVLRRPELDGIPSAVEASRQAYAMAGVGPREIRVACVHDCFTIAEIMAYEDLGFCDKGQGGAFIEARQPYIGGATPTNVDGGLKAKGHPIGATGAAMVYEIVRQLRGECGERQVPGADVGLVHNVGGIGQYCFVHVFRRD